MTIMLLLVSLGSYSLAILGMCARHTRLELCSRDYDNDSIHNPESLGEGIGVMGRRPGPGLNPPKQGDVIPNLPALVGTLPFRAGRRSASSYRASQQHMLESCT